MEPDASRLDEPRPPAPSHEPARTEWRALARLRERVETAAREIERLRAENRELAARLEASGDGPSLPLDGDASEVREQIQGFIDAIDRVLEAPEGDGAAASTSPL